MLNRKVAIGVLTAAAAGAVAVGWFARPAPKPKSEPALLSLTMFVVCDAAAGLLVVDTDGKATWLAEPMEPGFRMGLLSQASDASILVEITPVQCKEIPT